MRRLVLRSSVASSLVVLVAGLSAAVTPAAAAPIVRVATTTYPVYGATEAAIRTSVNARRPGNYDARTQWYVTWSYRSAPRGGRCVSVSRNVRLRITFTYPAWRAPSAATSQVRQRWARYMTRLRVHEAGHATNGRRTASRIDQTLRRTAAADCAALDRSLRARIAGHFAAGNAADRAYDRRTRHGATQGAVFP